MGTGERRLKRLIVTADDFGVSAPVNAAVEDAHRNGVLTAACLMVSGAAADDAVARARTMPRLGVGLHVVVARGRPVLPASEVPHLVDRRGRFDDNLVRAGFRYFFLPHARRQLAREIRAQFRAFAETGLPLDHVNAHNHMHVHPTVLSLILRIGPEFGLRAVRVPWEPPAQGAAPSAGERFVGAWIWRLRRRAARAGVRVNDRIFGLRDSGRMDRGRLLSVLGALPDGITEIVTHPATARWPGIDAAAHDYRFEAEYEALLDGAVRRAAAGAELISFRDIP